MKRKITKESVCFVLCCLITALFFAWQRSANGDFVAYNGDFQNYNIFRRLLDGQVQFRDFTNYLGVGFLIINMPFIYFFRNFGDSVFITNFTASVLYSIIILTAVYTVSKNRKRAYVIASVIPALVFIILNSNLSGWFYYNLIYDVAFMEELGHSMRTARAFLPYLLVIIFYFYKMRKGEERVSFQLFEKRRNLIVISLILGMFIVWSNDFGFSCIGCFWVMLFIFQELYFKKGVKERILSYIISIVCAGVGFLCSVAVVTHGSISAYFNTTLGITSYQFWYYGSQPYKDFTVYDIFADIKFAIMTVIFFIYAIKFVVDLVKDKIDDYRGVLLFLQSTNYAAALIYVIGSGSHNYAALELILFISIADTFVKWMRKISASIRKRKEYKFEIGKAALIIKRYKKGISITTFIVLMLIIYGTSVRIVYADTDKDETEYVEGLNVNTTVGQGVEEVAQMLSGEEVFSTYASAIETINGVFQPSGIDYIIHVLGDEKREKYMDTFLSGDYTYVSTLKNDYTTWEYWATRSNWFFYRELLKSYEPCEQTNYSIIWKKSEETNQIETEVKLTIEQIDGATSVINIELPDYDEDVYVDLKLSYTTEWTKERVGSLGIRKAVSIMDGGEKYNTYNANSCYYLKENAEGYYVPVYVSGGKAQITVTSNPEECTKLIGLYAVVEGVMKAPWFELTVANYSDVERKVVDSISSDGTLLRFVNTESNNSRLKNVVALSANGQEAKVDNMWCDGDYLYVRLEEEIDQSNFQYPNSIEVEKGGVAADISDQYWIGGIRRNEAVILLEGKIDGENLKAIKCGKTVKKVESVEWVETYTRLRLEDGEGIQTFAYPQRFELIYE